MTGFFFTRAMRTILRWPAHCIQRSAMRESQSMPSNDQQPGKKNALTPLQLGACVGAVVAILGAFVVRDSSRPVGNPNGEPRINIPNYLFGVLGGVGGVAGMAAVALFQKTRGPKNPPESEAAQPSSAPDADKPSR